MACGGKKSGSSLLQKRYRIESLYELAKNYAQIEWRYIEFR